jgi:peptidoglycan/xylan/chitin deacetylase (PgdA/CDA1 family)
VSIEYGMTKLFDVFRKHEVTATFFVPGEVAAKQKESVKLILKEGHELACHGLKHDKNEFLLPYDQQFRSVKEATEILEREIGVKPKGFRAPCLRANGVTVRVLESLDYAYDSSVLPSFVPGYYGNITLKSKPYRPSCSSIREKGKSRILELPVSVNPLFRIPLSAAWMRNLGFNWLKTGIKLNYKLGNPVVFYIHPRDVTNLPRIKGIPWHLYTNVGQKSERILDQLTAYAQKHGEVISGIELVRRHKESRKA